MNPVSARGWQDVRWWHVVALALLAAACGCSDKSKPAGEGAAPDRQAEIELILGRDDGPDALLFSRITGLTVDAGGRIFVADHESNEIRVFERDGRFVFRIGRRGQGPGELSGPCCLALRDEGRTLWVRDGGNARYESFAVNDTSADHRSFVRFAHTDVNRHAPLTFDAEGNIIDIGAGRRGSDGRAPIVRYHLDAAGRVIREDTLAQPPADSVPMHSVTRKVAGGEITMFVYPSYPPLALQAHAPNGEWAQAVSSRYSIGWFGGDGQLLRTIERQVDAPLLTAAERARSDSMMTATAKRLNVARGDIPFGVPNRKQPLRDLFFDLEGRLWVELFVAEGEPPAAHVYSPDGRLLFTARWPARTDLAGGAAGGDIAYGVQRDSLDTQRIVRLRFQ